MKKFLTLLLVISLTACTSSRGFDRGSLRSQLTSSQKQVTEADIKKVFDIKPQLPMPFKLAVYFTPARWGNWGWLGEDKNKLLSLAADLKAKHIVSDMFVLNDALLEGSDNKAIRLAAARAGADAVLIVNGVSDVDSYNNPLGASYFLLVTPFFVPGSEADAIFMMNASMWDVRNQYLYLSVEAESSASETRPAFFLEESRVVKNAKNTAVSALAKELATRLNNMAAK